MHLPERNKNRLWKVLLAVPFSLAFVACSGNGPQSALEPSGPIADDLLELWDLVFGLAVAVFVMVTGLLLWALWRYRERPGDESEPKQIHGSSVIEVGGVIFSVVLLAVITVPTVQGIFEWSEVPEGPDVIDVKVTGHQWWWEFEYPDEVSADGRTLITANELHIPEDTDVYLSMSSADVIHSFWVPVINGKRDLVPGRVTHLTLNAADPTPDDEPIPGQCAEFCGLAHADMRIKLFVHTAEGYEQWVEEQLAPSPIPEEGTLAGAGWETFNALCTTCHQATVEDVEGEITTIGPNRVIDVDGEDFRSSFGPNLTHLFSRTTIAAGILTLDADHLSQWIDNPSALKPMDPSFNDLPAGRIYGMPDLGLNQIELDEVVALLETWR